MAFASEEVMTTKKRRERDRERMRRRILDAAKQLFVKEGFDNVSLRRIASTIEYSPAAIYRYFKNKREILSVLREEGFRSFVEAQEKRADTITDPLERLKAGGRGYIKFALTQPENFHLMFCTKCDEVDLEGDHAESSLESYNLFRQSVKECVALGHFGDVDVDTVVFSLWAGVHGLSHLINTGRVDVLAGDLELDPLMDRILGFQLRPGVKK